MEMIPLIPFKKGIHADSAVVAAYSFRAVCNSFHYPVPGLCLFVSKGDVDSIWRC